MRLITTAALVAALTGCTANTAAPEQPPTAGADVDGVVAVSTVTETVLADPPTALDHGGFGPIRIGSTFAEVEATGLIGRRSSPDAQPCAYHDFTMPLRGSVVFDRDRRVSSIIISRGPGTVEGVGNGDLPSRVPEVYPSAVRNEFGYLVPLDTSNTYGFYSIDGTVITTVDLRRAGQTCHR
ncbi:hypothetical protein [Saccharothrix xinjiangensis]|uniref:Lipoprotein n=1 Tax=Saccharothrix xinjiangensis TaxID=204798 RepID=A0ABV9XSR9_9PSEU